MGERRMNTIGIPIGLFDTKVAFRHQNFSLTDGLREAGFSDLARTDYFYNSSSLCEINAMVYSMFTIILQLLITCLKGNFARQNRAWK